MHLYEYHAKVVRVIDGDTLDLDVSLGFYVTQKVRVRLAGVNTPEMHDTDATKRAAAQAAKSFVEGLVLNKDVELKTVANLNEVVQGRVGGNGARPVKSDGRYGEDAQPRQG